MRASIQIREEEYFDTILQYSAAAGFKEISVSFGSCPIIADDELERDTDRIGNLLVKYGIACTQIHLPCYHLLVDSSKKEAHIEKAICQYLRAGAALGAAWGAFHPRSAINDGYNRKKSPRQPLRRQLSQAFCRLCHNGRHRPRREEGTYRGDTGVGLHYSSFGQLLCGRADKILLVCVRTRGGYEPCGKYSLHLFPLFGK